MSWLITATVAMAVGTGVQVYGEVQAGKAQADALKEQARQEKIAAEGRELERQQQLGKVLAANNVGLAAGGMEMEGTPSSISLESAKNVGISEGMIGMSDRLALAQKERQAKNVRSAANLQAASSLLSGASSAAQLNA